MLNHDHSKLEPILDEINQSIKEKDYISMSINLKKCLIELQNHIDWENSESGVIHFMEKNHPEFRDDIIELKSDHLFFIKKIEEAVILAENRQSEAIDLFMRFILRRQEHIYHEDELDIKAHTKNFNDFIH